MFSTVVQYAHTRVWPDDPEAPLVYEPYEPSWHSVTAADETIPLDRSHGRLQRIEEDLFYSPNSFRSVKMLPPSLDQGREHNPFHSGKPSGRTHPFPTLKEIQQPRWWTPNFGWLAFLPLRPSFDGALFGRLAHLPTHWDEHDGRYKMPADEWASWRRLEKGLLDASSALNRLYRLGTMAPFLPGARGYTRDHASPAFALKAVRAARNCFGYWMGLLSYQFARAKCLEDPGWHSFLLDSLKLSPLWSDCVHASDIGTYTREVPRAGVFLYLSKKDIEATQQPSVHWFVSHNIPVWYKWGQEEVERAKREPAFAALGPLPEQMEDVVISTTDLAKPIAISLEPIESSFAQIIRLQQFFQKRDDRRPHLLDLGTPIERERRLNRERCPPRKTARVYVWDRGDLLVREEVLASEREETLAEYGINQKHYDSFWNEWDCCFALGPPDSPLSDDGIGHALPVGEDEYLYDWESDTLDMQNLAPIQSQEFTPLSEEDYERIDPPPINFRDHAQGPACTLDGLVQEVQELLFLHYGLVMPVPLKPPSSEQILAPKIKKFWMRWIGLCSTWKGENVLSAFWESEMMHFFVDFTFQVMNMELADCDLTAHSRQPLALSKRLRFLHETIKETDDDFQSRSWFVFDFGEDASVPWRLAVTTAADALFVCRLDSRFVDVDIARFLAERGIAFHTLIPRLTLPIRSVCPDVLPYLPHRPPGYTFTKLDYEVYLHCRSQILRRPRVRAAVLRGGQLWRLTIGSLSIDEILHGPMGGGSLFEVKDEQGIDLLDDKLSQHEMDLLSGMYICYTGEWAYVLDQSSCLTQGFRRG
ncbi:hypothetical protein K443DRAFT_6143 [Laccaria amethystina LaAM-08-1]|uniref:Uncharacterized protein n=1 Tax=Laccaria amethystina LaAM-08-1 TaxID=1095629 RepID=A0A0C9WTJ4_9AGAR|nr:hypothetical protein K443DRAFT_6143 [Laccaria amethystina LaAM-08-1]